MDHPDDGESFLHQRDRHPDDGEAVHEVRGAVERIDEPVARRRDAASLFTDHRDAGFAGQQDLLDRPFAGVVDLRDVVAGRLFLERRAPGGVADQ